MMASQLTSCSIDMLIFSNSDEVCASFFLFFRKAIKKYKTTHNSRSKISIVTNYNLIILIKSSGLKSIDVAL